MDNKKKLCKSVNVIGIILLVCIVFTGLLYFDNGIGVSEANLEADIRSSQKIVDDWIIDGSISDTMAAFISYSQDKADHTFSVYVNRPGLSFGYFFRGGGDIVAVENYIAEYTLEGDGERAFISMNNQKVECIEIDDGNSIEVIDVDCNKPFRNSMANNRIPRCNYNLVFSSTSSMGL